MEDVLKSYLVALGFKVDNASYHKMQDTLRGLDNSVKSITAGMARNFGYVGAAAASSFVTVAVATADMMDKVAQADLGYQKFAMRMYMAKDAAKQFKIVTDSMGESVNDIAWMPELNERYRQLMKEAKGMETPEDAERQLRYIRDIRFEFTRMKVEATYGLQWVGYYLFKYFNVPIKEGKTFLQEVNDYIQQKIPEWSEKIAFGLAYVYDAIKPTGEAFKMLFEDAKALFDLLPSGVKKIIVIGAAILALVAVGSPVALAITGFGAFVAVIQDFFRYIDGGRTAKIFDGFYNTIFKFSTKLAALWKYFKKNKVVPSYEDFTGEKPGEYTKMYNEMYAGFEQRRKAGTLRKAGAAEEGAAEEGEITQADLDKIASIESQGSGDYNAVGPMTKNAQGVSGRAMGRYGIMDYNWGPWAVAAGLPYNAPMTPENQDRVAKHRLQEYMKRYKRKDLVYAAWHGGPGAANALERGDLSALARRDSLGTSIGDYMNKAGSEYYPSGAAGNYMPGNQQTNNIEINLYGQNQEEQANKIREIMQDLKTKDAIKMNRMPVVPGIGQ